MWISWLLPRLPALYRHRREVWWAIKDAGMARVDRRGVVWIPTSDLERRTAAFAFRYALGKPFAQRDDQVRNILLAMIRRLEVADVATRDEVRRVDERPALGI